MIPSSVRNATIFAAIVASGTLLSILVTAKYSPAAVVSKLGDFKILQLAIVTAVLALLYKLYDAAFVGGLSMEQSALHEERVIKKSWRLWALIGLHVAPIAISILGLSWVPLPAQNTYAVIGLLTLAVAFGYSLYLPWIWKDWLRFQTNLKRDEVEKKRAKDYLDEWQKKDRSPDESIPRT